jgi:hypothetical protein
VCRCVVEAAAALFGHEGSGGHGLVGAVFPGQEGSDVRLKKGNDNQHVFLGGHVARHGGGCGTASAMATIGNDIPCTS